MSNRNTQETPRIPRGALREGILDCLTVASLRLEETDALLKLGLPTQAGVLFSFAVEEFGKSALLKEAQTSSSADDPVAIEGFYSHRAKLAAAAKHVDPEFLYLTGASLDLMMLTPLGLKPGQQVDFAARLRGLFVDWRDGRWVHGQRVDPEILAASIAGLQRAIQERMVTWL